MIEAQRKATEFGGLHTLNRAPMVLRIMMAAMDTTVLVSPWSQFHCFSLEMWK